MEYREVQLLLGKSALYPEQVPDHSTSQQITSNTRWELGLCIQVIQLLDSTDIINQHET